MKKNILNISIVAFLSLLFVGCNNQGKALLSKDNQVKFDTLVIAKKHYLRNDTSNHFCDLNIDFVYPI